MDAGRVAAQRIATGVALAALTALFLSVGLPPLLPPTPVSEIEVPVEQTETPTPPPPGRTGSDDGPDDDGPDDDDSLDDDGDDTPDDDDD